MSRNQWDHLGNGITEEQLVQWQSSIQEGGYSAFHMLLEGFKARLKTMKDDEVHTLKSWLDKAAELFPEPGLFSPSWIYIWEELKQMTAIKQDILQTIPASVRDGEWQLILDNPHTIQEVVCHPGLTFDEAAYLYSYFRPGLQKNEYIRLQKIQNVLIHIGS